MGNFGMTPRARIGAQSVGSALVERGIPREGQLARGVHVATEHAGQRLAGLGADEPPLHHGRHAAEPRHGHGVARDADEDDARIDIGQGLDELVLAVGQRILLAVVALAVLVVALVQPAEDDDHVGLAGFLHSLAAQLLRRAGVAERAAHGDAVVALHGVAHVATGKDDGGAGREARDKPVEGEHLLLHLERRGAAAHGHHLDGVLAHHEHLPILLQIEGQQRGGLGEVGGGGILQQYDALLGYLQGSSIVGVGTEGTIGALAVHGGAEVEAQHAAHLLVELAGGVLSAEDGLLVGLRQEIALVGVRGTHRQAVGPRAHLQVETVADSLVGVVAAAPVADDHAVEAPVAFQHLVQQRGVMTVVLVLIEVVGTHETPCPTLLHGSAEGRQIDFVEGALADDDVHLVAVLLVVVQRIVLHAGGHALRLQALDVRSHHARGETGVFAHVLEVATVQGCAQNVDAGAQDDVLAAIEGFLAQALAVEAGHRGVPRCCQTGEGREGHARVVGLSGLLPLVPEHVGTHAVGAVVGPQVGDAQTGHAGCRELRLGMDDAQFLVERHAAEGIADALLQRLRLIEIDRQTLLPPDDGGRQDGQERDDGSFHKQS